MQLPFPARLAERIKNGTIRQSIRARRHSHYRIKIGDKLDCFSCLRLPDQELLGRWPCIHIDDILWMPPCETSTGRIGLLVNGKIFDDASHERLAIAEGYDDFAGMVSAFEVRLKQDPIWRGDIIHWDFDNPLVAPGRARDLERTLKLRRKRLRYAERRRLQSAISTLET